MSAFLTAGLSALGGLSGGGGAAPLPPDVISTGPVISGRSGSGFRFGDLPPFVWIGGLMVVAVFVLRK